MAISKIGSDGLNQAGDTILCADSGNVGVGTSSPAAKLSVYGATENQIRVTDDAAYYYSIGRSSTQGFLTFYGSQAAATGYIFTGAAGERMRIDSSGNLLVGTTAQFGDGKQCNQFAGATQNGIVLKTTYAPIGSNFLLFFNSAGSVAGYIVQNGTTTVAYATPSDYRMKENIAPMTGALTAVSQLKPCTYTWKEDGKAGQGFIAHELQAVVPDCVSGEKDAINEDGSIKPQGIDTSFLVATLTAAIQELKAINDAQAQTIESLTARVSALEAS